MSIQFPSPASQGDTFTASNGVIYTYDNGGWTANSVSGLDATYVNRSGDTMTGDLTVPNLISEGDVQTTSLNGGPLAGLRNQIINGSFECWQRSIDVTSAGSGYKTADRWYVETNGINTVSKRIDIDNTTNALKDEAPTTYGMRLHANGAPLEVRQCIELTKIGAAQQFLPGTKWFVSWYSDLRNGSTGLDGTFINCRVAFMDNASDPGANTEIIGALVNLGGRRWGFPIEIQSTPPSTATCLRIDLITANVNEFEFTAIQLEPGPVATPFEHRPIGIELALCQRYFYYTDRAFNCMMYKNNDSRIFYLFFPVNMRTNPTCNYVDSAYLSSLSLPGYPEYVVLQGTSTDTSRGGYIGKISADAEL